MREARRVFGQMNGVYMWEKWKSTNGKTRHGTSHVKKNKRRIWKFWHRCAYYTTTVLKSLNMSLFKFHFHTYR